MKLLFLKILMISKVINLFYKAIFRVVLNFYRYLRRFFNLQLLSTFVDIRRNPEPNLLRVCCDNVFTIFRGTREPKETRGEKSKVGGLRL